MPFEAAISTTMSNETGEKTPSTDNSSAKALEPQHPPRVSSLTSQSSLSPQSSRPGPPPDQPLPQLPTRGNSDATPTRKSRRASRMSGPWLYCTADQLPPCPGPPPVRDLPPRPDDVAASSIVTPGEHTSAETKTENSTRAPKSS